MSEPAIRRIIRVSEKAFHRIKEMIEENPDFYRGRGAVGVVDNLLFEEFTTDSRGPKPKKVIDKR